MRAEERIFQGIVFNPGDPELKAIKLRTHNLDVEYNQTFEDETEKRAQLLSQMVGQMGEGGFIQGPVYFHYGKHTKIGSHFFGNFNLTIQDDGEVTIGDHCNFGPGVTIVTPVHPMIPEERNALVGPDGRPQRLCYAKPVHIRQQRVAGSQCGGVPRGHHRGRLCHRRRSCSHPGYPSPLFCGWEPLPGHPGDHPRRQYGPQARDPGRVFCAGKL